MEEGEVGGFRETGPENAVIDHGEVERRDEEILAVIGNGGGDSGGGGGDGGDKPLRRRRLSDLERSSAHLGPDKVVLAKMAVHFHNQRLFLVLDEKDREEGTRVFIYIYIYIAYREKKDWDRRGYSFAFGLSSASAVAFAFGCAWEKAISLSLFPVGVTVEKGILEREREREMGLFVIC